MQRDVVRQRRRSRGREEVSRSNNSSDQRILQQYQIKVGLLHKHAEYGVVHEQMLVYLGQ